MMVAKLRINHASCIASLASVLSQQAPSCRSFVAGSGVPFCTHGQRVWEKFHSVGSGGDNTPRARFTNGALTLLPLVPGCQACRAAMQEIILSSAAKLANVVNDDPESFGFTDNMGRQERLVAKSNGRDMNKRLRVDEDFQRYLYAQHAAASAASHGQRGDDFGCDTSTQRL